MAKRKRNIEAFSLSFLDCICCGFGAIVLLLVLSKIYEPVILEKTNEDLAQLIAKLQEWLFQISGETTVMNRALGVVQLETSETKMRLTTLQRELDTVQGQYDLLNTDDPALNVDEGELRAARQRLSIADHQVDAIVSSQGQCVSEVVVPFLAGADERSAL